MSFLNKINSFKILVNCVLYIYIYIYIYIYVKDFPGGSDGKVSVYNAGGLGSIHESGRFPGEGNGNPLQYSCLENPMDEEPVAGYCPWGHKKS